MTNNKTVIKWLDEMKELLTPDSVVWIDGSDEQREALREEAVKLGELTKLNQDVLPGCYLHRTNPNDVARVEDRTFICSKTKENAGPTNNWCDPDEMYEKLYKIAKGSYKGRTMYVIPYSMGPIGSPLAKVGIEITDSIYVVLNMLIMTRVSFKVLEVLGDSNDWYVVCIPVVTSIPKIVTSATSPKITPLSLLTPVTAVTYFSVKSASHFVLLLTKVGRKAGWLSICSS